MYRPKEVADLTIRCAGRYKQNVRFHLLNQSSEFEHGAQDISG
jgi:hypothetical protein